MKTQGEHIRTLRRRVDFLKTRDHKNSYDQAELGALEWALVNLPPAQRTWVGLTDEEIHDLSYLSQKIDEGNSAWFDRWGFARAIEAKLREKNGGEYRNRTTTERTKLNQENT
jgi:hypothetical protein